jgi:hypothetical protein
MKEIVIHFESQSDIVLEGENIEVIFHLKEGYVVVIVDKEVSPFNSLDFCSYEINELEDYSSYWQWEKYWES